MTTTPSSQLHAPSILWFEDPAAADPRRAGRKAAALAGRLPVPRGFVVTGTLDAALVARSYAELGGGADPFVAVRFSAIDEDGLQTSFARPARDDPRRPRDRRTARRDRRLPRLGAHRARAVIPPRQRPRRAARPVAGDRPAARACRRRRRRLQRRPGLPGARRSATRRRATGPPSRCASSASSACPSTSSSPGPATTFISCSAVRTTVAQEAA